MLLSALLAIGQMAYPPARVSDVVEDHFGVQVADPYRWMEDLDSAETKAWVAAENKLSFGYLKAIPQRKEIENRLTKLWRYERFGIPNEDGGIYFSTYTDGKMNQPVYRASVGRTGKPWVVLDPNKMSKDGTAAISGFEPSHDGRMVAYSVSLGGSDWQEWRVIDTRTKRLHSDKIVWSKFSGASWLPDGSGFYYSRYDAPQGNSLQGTNEFQKLYFHKLGTAQSRDVLVYERKDQKDWGFVGTVTEDGRYLVITAWNGTNPETRIFYKDLRDRSSRIRPLFDKGDASYGFLGNEGGTFYFLTDKDAPNRKVIAADATGKGSSRTVVAEAKENLESASFFRDRLFLSYLKDSHSVVKIASPAGKSMGSVQMPGIGTASGFGGRQSARETFFDFTSYTVPRSVYRLDFRTGKVSVQSKPKVPADLTPYSTEQVFFRSKDGTRIPMFLTYRKGLTRNGLNPTLITGYGGFNAATTPYFSPRVLAWLEMGGVFAEVVLRGGSDYGRKWYDAGRLMNKQNVFDDFIAGAEWLIAKKITSSAKLACEGASNGGLLIGAVMTQRPDLWGACLPDVGVMDMLRFHKFTIGAAWMSDYGNPDVEADFKNLLKFSPLHNVKPGTAYPPTLITTGDHDDRVVPNHSFKFAATLQAAQQGTNPILIRIETSAGHGAGKPIAKQIEEFADQFAFLWKHLGMK